MPAWLLPVLLSIVKGIWHAVCRFWSVFLVAAVIGLILMRFHMIKLDQYNIGYKKGYSQALLDHPAVTMGPGGTVINYDVKTSGIEIANWGFGLWHRR